MEGVLGEIKAVGFNFAPRNWSFCHGQLIPVSQNSALFSLLGTIYGGDGRSTFALPDLRGRAMIGAGNGSGLNNMRLGQRGGTEYTTLNVSNMPSHAHGTSTFKAELNVGRDNKDVFVQDNGDGNGNTENSGGGQEFNNRPPYLAVNYIICVNGIFPSRS